MIPEGCFPVYSQIRSDAYHAGICQIFIYIKSFWQWKFYSASRSHTDHKTILTRFGCWILTVTVSKNTVAHADIFLNGVKRQAEVRPDELLLDLSLIHI